VQTKEESHGEEEEGQEEDEVNEVLKLRARTSYWGRAGMTFGFRGVFRSRQAAEHRSAAFALAKIHLA
jgi:hypothetical protein